MVFAKKTQSINLDGDMYVAEVESFTHKNKNQVIVSKKYLNEGEHVLIIDDFLANGCAMMGLIDIVKASGATLVGVGAVIEKGFRRGGDMLRRDGIRVESLAIIDDMTDDSIVYRD